MARTIDWVDQASCKGQSQLFFSPFGERPDTREAREAMAKAICTSCPVQPDCLAVGRQHHEYGIWGGENEEERVHAGYRLLAPIGTRERRSA